MMRSCNTCMYAGSSRDEKPCSICDEHYDKWEEGLESDRDGMVLVVYAALSIVVVIITVLVVSFGGMFNGT